MEKHFCKYNNSWNESDLAKLRDIYQKYSLKEMSIIFGRSVSKICRKARSLGLKKDRKIHSKNISIALKNAYNTGTRPIPSGDLHPRWKGGITQRKDGYFMVRISKSKRVLLHRYIVEQFIGRQLTKKEIVHHVNSNCLDNRIENLQVMTQSEHIKLHNPKKYAINNI